MRARVIPGFVQRGVAAGRMLVVLDGEAAAHGHPLVTVTSSGTDVEATLTIVAEQDPAFRDALVRRGVALYPVTLGPVEADVVEVTVAMPGVGVIARRSFAPVPRVMPPEGLCLAVASCYYDYGGGAPSFAKGLRTTPFGAPHLDILLGDNVYLDVVPGQAFRDDPYGETVDVYARYFLESAYGDALEQTPTITTWDDHELWNNYPEEQVFLARSHGARAKVYEAAAQRAIERFQQPLNPVEEARPLDRSFEFTIDPVSFFVADLRTRRSRHAAPERRMLPKDEIFRLTSWARGLKAPGVLVIGQPLWIEKGDINDYTPPDFEEEYGHVWAALADARYDVLVLAGDVHHSRVVSLWTRGGYVHEITTSPAVHIPPIAGVALGSILGTSVGQERTAVEYPGAIAIDPKFGVRPALAQVLFAHDAPNTFAAIQLRAVNDERIDVGIAMPDHRSRGIPASTVTSKLATCFTPGAFSLLARNRPE